MCRSQFHHQHQRLSQTRQSDRDCWSFLNCSAAHTLCFSLLAQAWTIKQCVEINPKTNDFASRILNFQFPLLDTPPGNQGICNHSRTGYLFGEDNYCRHVSLKIGNCKYHQVGRDKREQKASYKHHQRLKQLHFHKHFKIKHFSPAKHCVRQQQA